MSHRRSKHGAGSALIIVLIAFNLVSSHWLIVKDLLHWLVPPLILLFFAGFTIKFSKVVRKHRLSQTLTLSGVDTMTGLEFELYIAQLLMNLGYIRVKLTEKYDLGVDIIAQEEDVTWGVQVKHYSGLVKAEAVRQVVTALNEYDCDRSMVITNSTFSNQAIQLANSNNCILIDRNILIELIELQNN